MSLLFFSHYLVKIRMTIEHTFYLKCDCPVFNPLSLYYDTLRYAHKRKNNIKSYHRNQS